MSAKHTFAICAYGESPYLEECVQSLQAQTVPSELLIATSTDNPLIRSVAEKYSIPVFVSPKPSGIGRDWNFALSCVKTPFATIAHQDDLYLPRFTQLALQALSEDEDSLISFANYQEMRQGQALSHGRNLLVKDALLFLFRILGKNRRLRRQVLGIGNFVCCPAVSYHLPTLNGFAFREDMRSNLDWDAWERIFAMKGDVVYITEKLMVHRIHPNSETSRAIVDSKRTQEDLELLCRFWPRWFAGWLNRFYQKAQDAN